MRKSKLKARGGFTLIEVLIVIVILAILAGLALPIYTAQTNRAYRAEALAHLGALKTSMITYYVSNTANPNSFTGATFATIGYNPNTVVAGQTMHFVYTIPLLAAQSFTLSAAGLGNPIPAASTVTLDNTGLVGGTLL